MMPQDNIRARCRPFIVRAGEQTGTVLGTKFSLLREVDQLRVAVQKGRVQMKAPRDNPTVLTRDEAALAERITCWLPENRRGG